MEQDPTQAVALVLENLRLEPFDYLEESELYDELGAPVLDNFELVAEPVAHIFVNSQFPFELLASGSESRIVLISNMGTLLVCYFL